MEGAIAVHMKCVLRGLCWCRITVDFIVFIQVDLMEGKCFFSLFLVSHSASERGRKELGTVRLLRSRGGGGKIQ